MRKKIESVMLNHMQKELFEELRSHPFYQMLFQLASTGKPRHILEIGSGDGLGSTRILSAALQATQPDANLFCIESEFARVENLLGLYPQEQVQVFHGLSDNQVEMPTAKDIMTFYRQELSFLRRYPLEQVLKWLADEESVVQKLNGQASGIELIQQKYQIQYFDLVLLDGGEFSGANDLALVYGAQTIVLDDIMTYKNWNNHRFLKQDPNYYMIYEKPNWGHGCSAFVRRQALVPGIGAVVHTLNAEAQIEDCLKTLSWVDKIWVIDMYSQDQTTSIAQSCGATVIPHLPMDCVDESRNFGLAQVDREWTLVLDVDERIPESLAQTIQSEFNILDKTGYWVPRQNYYFGESIPALFPDYQMRLFRSQRVLWSGKVHQHPWVDGETTAFPAELPYAIEHRAYDHLQQFVNKQLAYAELSVQQKQTEASHSVEADNILDLRQAFAAKQRQYLKANGQTVNHQTWLIQQLYLFSDLSELAVKILSSGQFKTPGISKTDYKLSAFSYLKNGISFDYPFIESLLSVAPICDQIVVVCARESIDGTREALQDLQSKIPQLKLHASDIWQRTDLRQGELIRLAAEEAEAFCDGDWLWHVQADEVYLNADIQKVKSYLEQYHHLDIDGFYFQVLHFYADYDMLIGSQGAKAGWYQETMRLSRRGKAKHFQDAWTQILKDPHSKALRTPIRIFHYGHVREKEAMRIKSTYMERLYHDLPQDYEVCAPQEFEYNAVQKELLEAFVLDHPETMLKRIALQRLAQSLESWTSEFNRKQPRVLVIGRYPGVKKGYGITFDQLYQTGVLQESFEMHHLAWHYKGPNQIENGIHYYSDASHPQGGPGVLRELLYELEPDLILIHADPHFFISYQKELKAWKGPVIGWFTIDYERDTNPAPLEAVFNRCQRILALAEFGRKQIQKSYSGVISKVPLSVNTQLFHPVDAAQKRLLKQQFQLPEQGFVFLLVANNFWRKGLEYALQAMAIYHQVHGIDEPVYLYLHTEKTEELTELVQGLDLQKWVIITPDFDPYKNPWPDQKLAHLYQACDAFLLTSLGEGFGMPVWEAQATGLPVIASDNSVLAEVAGPDALLIPTPGWVPGHNGDRVVWMKSPDPEIAAQLMFQLISDPELYWRLATESLKKIYRYSWFDCALKLRTELALGLGTGTLEYYPAEPDLYLL